MVTLRHSFKSIVPLGGHKLYKRILTELHVSKAKCIHLKYAPHKEVVPPSFEAQRAVNWKGVQQVVWEVARQVLS